MVLDGTGWRASADQDWGQGDIPTAANVGFNVLGTELTFDNKFDVELEYRLSRANNALYANWDLLGCKSVPLRTRLKVSRAVGGAMEFDQRTK